MIDQNKKNLGPERKQEDFKKDEKKIQPNVRQSERQADGVSRVKGSQAHEANPRETREAREARELKESRDSSMHGQTNKKSDAQPKHDRDLRR